MPITSNPDSERQQKEIILSVALSGITLIANAPNKQAVALPTYTNITAHNCTLTITSSEIRIKSPEKLDLLFGTPPTSENAAEPPLQHSTTITTTQIDPTHTVTKIRQRFTTHPTHPGLTPLCYYHRTPKFGLTIYKEVAEALITECTRPTPIKAAHEIILSFLPSINRASAKTYAYAYRDYIIDNSLLPESTSEEQLYTVFPQPRELFLHPKPRKKQEQQAWVEIGHIDRTAIYNVIYNEVMDTANELQTPIRLLSTNTIRDIIMSRYEKRNEPLRTPDALRLAYDYKSFILSQPAEMATKILAKLPPQFNYHQVLGYIPGNILQHTARERMANFVVNYLLSNNLCSRHPSLPEFIKA